MFPSVSIPASVLYWTFCSGIVVAASAKLRRKLTSTHLHTLHLRFRVSIFNGHRKSEFVPGLLPYGFSPLLLAGDMPRQCLLGGKQSEGLWIVVDLACPGLPL